MARNTLGHGFSHVLFLFALTLCGLIHYQVCGSPISCDCPEECPKPKDEGDSSCELVPDGPCNCCQVCAADLGDKCGGPKKKTCKKGLVCKPKSLEPWRNRRTDPPGVCVRNTPHCSEFYGSRRLGYMRVFVPVGNRNRNGYYNMDGCIYCKCPKAGGKAHCGDICDWLDLVRAQ